MRFLLFNLVDRKFVSHISGATFRYCDDPANAIVFREGRDEWAVSESLRPIDVTRAWCERMAGARDERRRLEATSADSKEGRERRTLRRVVQGKSPAEVAE